MFGTCIIKKRIKKKIKLLLTNNLARICYVDSGNISYKYQCICLSTHVLITLLFFVIRVHSHSSELRCLCIWRLSAWWLTACSRFVPFGKFLVGQREHNEVDEVKRHAHYAEVVQLILMGAWGGRKCVCMHIYVYVCGGECAMHLSRLGQE